MGLLLAWFGLENMQRHWWAGHMELKEEQGHAMEAKEGVHQMQLNKEPKGRQAQRTVMRNAQVYVNARSVCVSENENIPQIALPGLYWQKLLVRELSWWNGAVNAVKQTKVLTLTWP